MSSDSQRLRRVDLAMEDAAARAFLVEGRSGRLATVGPDGWPYVVPMLYVFAADVVYLHGSKAIGHLRTNLDHDTRVCFLVDEPGEVYACGRFECDSSLSYRSVMVFGQIRTIDDTDESRRFLAAFMSKYSPDNLGRPKGFFPRLEHIAVYALRIDKLSGKRIHLPAVSDQWPAHDRSKSPGATASIDRDRVEGVSPLPPNILSE